MSASPSKLLTAGVYMFAGGVLGVAGCFVSWGNPAKFHGTGFPFPMVVWDFQDGRLLDYPNPLGYIENPLAGAVLGLMVWGGIAFVRWGVRKLTCCGSGCRGCTCGKVGREVPTKNAK